MKVLVLGLEGADPPVLFQDERLLHVRQLMAGGCYGALEDLPPPTADSPWLSLLGGQPHDVVERALGDGLPVPPGVADLVREQGGRPVVVEESPGHNREALKEVLTPSRLFERACAAMRQQEWQYLQIVDAGLNRLRAAGQPAAAEPGSADPLASQVDSYYLALDEQLERLFELLDEDTAVAVIAYFAGPSADGPHARGGFILAAPGSPLLGEIGATRAIDLAPTLLRLGKWKQPATMPGHSLVEGLATSNPGSELSGDEEDILRERLSALGYIG